MTDSKYPADLANQPKARIQYMRYQVGKEDEPRTVDVPAYWCPVCKHPHAIATKKTGTVHKGWNGAMWGFNEDINAPTFTPSVLTYYTKHSGEYWMLKRHGKFMRVCDMSPGSGDDRALEFHDPSYALKTAEAHSADNAGHGWGVVPRSRGGEQRITICHVHVTNGMIQILPDTPGPLGGKTLPLDEWSWLSYTTTGKRE
jgi:hypothetical protein